MTNEELTRDAVALLEELVATPRHSREEKEAADLLERRMTEWGLGPQRDGNNLWCLAPDWRDDRPTLLLCAHIDTVRPAAGWTRDPYRPTWETVINPETQEAEERLYGLGTNDDGASLVSLLMAFRAVTKESENSKQKTVESFRDLSKTFENSRKEEGRTKTGYNLIFLASAEEEVSGRNGVEHVLPLLPRIDVGLVGEPTGMQPAVAEKGLMVLDCTAHGRAGHAARNEGDNALYHALDDIQWFRTFQFPRVSERLGAVKMSVTIIQAGTQHNVVPAECTFTVDVRSNELYSNEEIYNIVRAHVKSDVRARSFRLNSSSISLDHPLVKRILKSENLNISTTPFGSPTLSDQALMPFPTLKMGPGQSSRSHTADEHILRAEIADSIGTYCTLLR